jgi:hypothetical protein
MDYMLVSVLPSIRPSDSLRCPEWPSIVCIVSIVIIYMYKYCIYSKVIVWRERLD